MDMVIQTSLEALLLKATNPQNQNIDTAAVEAFCTLINKEKDGAHIGVKVIANRLPTGNEKEMLQTLSILDTCMNRCGSHFQSEVGKFRFLNEMIKLVSPKYLGSHTPLPVKQKVLQLMYLWTLDYPKESKIKEAYEMLRKQGVIREIPNPNIPIDNPNLNLTKKRQVNSIFQDEEKSKILQKLLQSKDPEDIQAANWLIKSMVKEDDKRAELKSKRVLELESVQNNVRLLNEMLDSYKPGISSSDELDLIKELHQSCERLRPNVMLLASESQQNEEMLGDILQTSDELGQVFNKYNRVIIKGQIASSNNHSNSNGNDNDSLTLLDFDNSVQNSSTKIEGASSNTSLTKDDTKSDIDVLCDIFNVSNNIPDNVEILLPTSVLSCDKNNGKESTNNKLKALEELDVLSEQLLRENLQSTGQTSFNKSQEKVPMNVLTKLSELKQNNEKSLINDSLNFDLNYLINEKPKDEQKITTTKKLDTSNNSNDDCLVDINDEKLLENLNDIPNKNNIDNNSSSTEENNSTNKNKTVSKNINDIKLNDIFVKLETIKPSTIPPITVWEEKNGINITLHFVKDKPREDVHVFVVTIINKNEMPINDFLFRASSPKGCKLKVQPASTTTLPGYNPFLPPSALTQIMLLACNNENSRINLKFIVSYAMDEETITETGDVDICL